MKQDTFRPDGCTAYLSAPKPHEMFASDVDGYKLILALVHTGKLFQASATGDRWCWITSPAENLVLTFNLKCAGKDLVRVS